MHDGKSIDNVSGKRNRLNTLLRAMYTIELDDVYTGEYDSSWFPELTDVGPEEVILTILEEGGGRMDGQEFKQQVFTATRDFTSVTQMRRRLWRLKQRDLIKENDDGSISYEGPTTFECPECNQEYITRASFARHLSTDHERWMDDRGLERSRDARRWIDENLEQPRIPR